MATRSRLNTITETLEKLQPSLMLNPLCHLTFRSVGQTQYGPSSIFVDSVEGESLQDDFQKGPYTYLLTPGREAPIVCLCPNSFYVYKFYKLSDMGVDFRLQKIQLHNFLFSEQTPYVVVGIATEQMDFGEEVYLIARQPYVEFIPNSGDEARKQLATDLVKRFGVGSIEIGSLERLSMYGLLEGDWYIKPEEIALDDLKNANIGINKRTGQYAVVDCIIKRVAYRYWKGKIARGVLYEM